MTVQRSDPAHSKPLHLGDSTSTDAPQHFDSGSRLPVIDQRSGARCTVPTTSLSTHCHDQLIRAVPLPACLPVDPDNCQLCHCERRLRSISSHHVERHIDCSNRDNLPAHQQSQSTRKTSHNMSSHTMPVRRDRDLMSWWKRFQTKGGNKKEEEKGKASFLPGEVTRDNALRSLSHLSLSSSSLPQPQPPFLYTPNSSSLSADSSVSPHPFPGDGGGNAHGRDGAPLEPTPPTSSGGHSGSEGLSTSENRRRSFFNPLKRRRASAVSRTEIIANAKGPHQRRSAGSLVGPLRSSTWSSSVLATSQTPPDNGHDSGATICATVIQVPSLSTPATSPVVSTASPVSSSAPAVRHSPSLTVIRNAAARALNPSRWLSRPESRRSAHAFPAYRSPAHRGSLFIAEETASAIFGIPLAESIKYANVAISLTDAEGKSFIYGYVPIVVAKCGVFLKEKGRPSRALAPHFHSAIS